VSLRVIKSMLQETIGLHSRSVGETSIERAIQHRMQALEISSSGEYLRKLRTDSKEFDELIEEVVVPETWFYRNVSPFKALASCLPILRNDRGGRDGDELKILSLPCSTGEEPYSIAMVLLDMEPPIDNFSIDAFDVSRRALRKARRAIYGRNSFREDTVGLRDRYFQRTGAGYQLSPAVKEHVRFSQANIITDSFDHLQENYHVIFCRNLLIYFDRQTQARVVEKLHRMLHPQGILFVGHAEAVQVSKHYFLPIDLPMAFAFRKSESKRESPALPASPGLPPGQGPSEKTRADGGKALRDLQNTFQDLVGLVEKDRRIGSRLSRKTTVAASTVSQEEGQEEGLEQAEDDVFERVLAYLELGRLGDAARLCESCLQRDPHATDAYYYLGMIAHLEGSPVAAETLLKRALYLNPDHHQAIGLLARLAEERGDADLAADYRRRQARAIGRDNNNAGNKA